MCDLTFQQKDAVKQKVTEFLGSGEPFTGQDVWAALQVSHGIRRDTSAHVRLLFNHGYMPGWASTQVVPKTGPVLYFKVHHSSKAGRAVKVVKAKLGVQPSADCPNCQGTGSDLRKTPIQGCVCDQ